MITTLNTDVSAPVMPEKFYGIVPDSPRLRNYLPIVIWGALLAGVLVGIVFIIMSDSPSRQDLGLTSLIPLCVTFIGFVNSFDDPGNHRRQATLEGKKRFYAWERDVLIPFLEEKHGVKFDKNSSFVGWDFPMVRKDGKHFEVKLMGMDFRESNFGPSEQWFWFPILEEEKNVYLTKVTRPKGVTYEDLEEI